jgi:hypothetical protein
MFDFMVNVMSKIKTHVFIVFSNLNLVELDTSFSHIAYF